MNHYTILPRVPLVSDRHMHVVERCRGKKVLHPGCVGAGLLDERFQAGELLHQKPSWAAYEGGTDAAEAESWRR